MKACFDVRPPFEVRARVRRTFLFSLFHFFIRLRDRRTDRDREKPMSDKGGGGARQMAIP